MAVYVGDAAGPVMVCSLSMPAPEFHLLTRYCVGSAAERFTEDYLRMLRAIRFSITKDMMIDVKIMECLENKEIVDKLAEVSVERVRDEMFKAFRHNTLQTLDLLECFPLVRDVVFGSSVPIFSTTLYDASSSQWT